ncbi:HNH endonuclease [Streptomyces sp. NPDC059874]|uniref:HNH endonuclease n=1 Tax=Streptomyces sp. NPDC059874 TaxID=3346983 RepID=UPI0036517847
MPRAASICLIRGCTLRTVRAGRCAEHAPAERAWARTSARNQARNRVWDRVVRPRALARDGFACVQCGERAGLEVDHVVPVAQGGTWELTNAQTLCKPCHSLKTLEERRQRGAGNGS